MIKQALPTLKNCEEVVNNVYSYLKMAITLNNLL